MATQAVRERTWHERHRSAAATRRWEQRLRNGELVAPVAPFWKAAEIPVSQAGASTASLMTTHASPLVAPCDPPRILARSGTLHHTRRAACSSLPHKNVQMRGKVWRGRTRTVCASDAESHPRPPGGLDAPRRCLLPLRQRETRSGRVMHVSYREASSSAACCSCRCLCLELVACGRVGRGRTVSSSIPFVP